MQKKRSKNKQTNRTHLKVGGRGAWHFERVVVVTRAELDAVHHDRHLAHAHRADVVGVVVYRRERAALRRRRVVGSRAVGGVTRLRTGPAAGARVCVIDVPYICNCRLCRRKPLLYEYA